MYAEEEARSASENQKWRIQKMFAEGRPNTGRMLGYYLKDGQLTIIPEEAEIVRMIFDDYLSGMGRLAISKKLNEMSIPTVRGTGEWREGSIFRILHNEKYTGDMLLQKTYTVDYLSKTVRKNNGEVKQYYVSNSHDAIVDEDTFNLVQAELARRSKFTSALRDNSVFSTKIICGECGYFYGRKTRHSTSEKHRKVVWYCNRRYDGEEKCSTPSISEPDIEKYYLIALKRLLSDKE